LKDVSRKREKQREKKNKRKTVWENHCERMGCGMGIREQQGVSG